MGRSLAAKQAPIYKTWQHIALLNSRRELSASIWIGDSTTAPVRTLGGALAFAPF